MPRQARNAARVPLAQAGTSTLVIPIAIIVDPATGKVTTNLKDKRANVPSGTLVIWEVTNTLLKTIKVTVTGLAQSMPPGPNPSITLKSSERDKIQVTVSNPDDIFPKILTYGLWIEIGKEQIAVDPDLEVAPPPDGVRGDVKDTAGQVQVAVTVDDFTPANDPTSLKANRQDLITWTISNTSTTTDIDFGIDGLSAYVTFDKGQKTTKVSASGTSTLQALVVKASQGTYRELVQVNGQVHEVDFDFQFS